MVKCHVDQEGQFPTHRPLVMEIASQMVTKITRELIKPTNFAQLFEDKVQSEYQQELEKYAAEKEDQGSMHEEDNKGPDENKISKKKNWNNCGSSWTRKSKNDSTD